MYTVQVHVVSFLFTWLLVQSKAVEVEVEVEDTEMEDRKSKAIDEQRRLEELKVSCLYL